MNILECKKFIQVPCFAVYKLQKSFIPEFEPIQIDGLREYDFGKYENKTAAELVDDKAFMDWLRNGTVPDGMENMHDFENRICFGFESILKDMMAHKLSSVAVITHGGVIMTLLAALGLPKLRS